MIITPDGENGEESLHFKASYPYLISILFHFGFLLLCFHFPTANQKTPPVPIIFETIAPPTTGKENNTRLRGKTGISVKLKHPPSLTTLNATPKTRIETSFFAGKKVISEDSFDGIDPKEDHRFSNYRKIHEKINNNLDYPTWLQKKQEDSQVIATIEFGPTQDRSFRICIESNSSLLRVHVSKLLRRLLQEELALQLRDLGPSPIFLYFQFHNQEPPKIKISHSILNNKLYFDRHRNREDSPLSIKETGRERTKYLEVNVTKIFMLFSKKNHAADQAIEEEYQLDPAYRDQQFIINGVFPT